VKNSNESLVDKTKAVEIINSEFVVTATAKDNLPAPSRPEVVFFGRSNVGKSSLINSLTGRKALARTSKQPGRTQALNFFDVSFRSDDKRLEASFVDAPGYGFAKVAKSMRGEWEKLLGSYLKNPERVAVALLLVDCRRDLKDEERWIEETVPSDKLIKVATKSDKVNQKERSAARKRLGSILFSSVQSGEGMAVLRNKIFERIESQTEDAVESSVESPD